MASIDERVVAMSFENAKFEANVAVTMTTLTKLDTAIKNIGSSNGLQNIENAANKVTLQQPMSALDKLKARFGQTNAGSTFSDMEKASNGVTLDAPMSALDRLKARLGLVNAGTTFSDMEKASDRVSFSGISSALENLGGKFSVLEGAASVALGNIVSKAVMAGTTIAKKFTLDPVMEGFHNYETQINAVQTILANTGLKGKAGLNQVNGALNNLNTYANKTVYNFSEMARNIGTFTAAGVKLGPAVNSIKGIANLAALSGSSSQQASTAMYQLSQAISAGQVHLQDWNSVVNAGMGGAVFQKALEHTAVAMGVIDKNALKIDKSTGRATIRGEAFRQSIESKPGHNSWLTSDVLTNTLQQFTGDLSKAQLAAQGFNDAQIKAIQAQAKTASDAATKIKTVSQLTQALKEEVGSAWANVFKTLFGDINQAKALFSPLHTVMENALTGPVNNFNKVLKDWSKLGGRATLISGLKDAFHDLGDVIAPIKEAFRDIFPAKTGKDLLDMTKGFADLMTKLDPSQKTVENLRKTFDGLFAIFHIGVTIVGDIIKVIANLLGTTTGAAGGFLKFTGSVGGFLTALDKAISKGHALDGFFNGLTNILKLPIGLISALAGAFFGLFDGVNASKAKGVEKSIGGVSDKLAPLKRLLDNAVAAWDSFSGSLAGVKSAISPFLNNVASVLSNFGKIVADGIKNTNFDLVFSAIQTTLIGGIFLSIKKALGGGIGLDIGGGVLGNLSKTFEALTGNLEAMQKNIQARTLLTIAAAVGVLAAAVVALSLIEPKKVASAMTAIAVGLGELSGTLAILSKVTKGGGIAALPIIAASMVGMAAAVLILSGAMKVMSTMSWEGIAKGLVGVAGSIVAVGLAMKLMGGGPGLILQGLGLMAVALALNVLAAAMKLFASMSWKEMGKGLLGLAGAMTVLSAGLYMIGPEVLLVGPGLVLVAGAITILSGAIQSFASMSWEELYKGIGGVAGALSAIAVAIQLIPPTVAAQAAGLVILAVALSGISAAVKLLGSMDLESLIKGITALAGIFLVLAVGLEAMAATLPGSAALLVAAAAIAILAPAIGLLGSFSWGTIFKGVIAIALALGTLALVGLVAAPALTALGIALLPLAAGFVIVAGAAYLFAKAMALLGDAGPKAVTVMVAALTGLVALLPTIVINFLKGLVGIAQAMSQVAPQVLLALGGMVDAIIAFVATEAPKLAIAIGVLVDSILQVLLTNSPKLIAAGFALLGNLLTGISQNIGAITDKVSDIVVKFLQALDNNMSKLINAGANTLIAFLNGISSKFGALQSAVDTMIGRFASAVASHAVNMVKIAGDMMLKFIGGIASYVPKVIEQAGNIILNVIAGLGRDSNKIVSKGADVIISFINGIQQNMNKIANKGADAVINFLNSLADTIRTKGPQLRAAGWNVASALLDGVWQGIDQLGQKVVDKLGALVRLLPGSVRKLLGIKSPSSVFAEIGKFTMLGFAQGIQNSSRDVESSANNVSGNLIGAFRNTLGIRSPSTVMQEIGKQVGAGFAKGLRGSQSDIQSAYKDLNDKLTQAMSDAKQAIVDNEKQLNDQRASSKPDQTAIAAAEKAILVNQDILNRTYAAHQLLTGALKGQRNELENLAKDYDKVSTKLDAAKQKLADAKQARNDELKSVHDQFDTLPSIVPDGDTPTTVADYAAQLTNQVAAVQKFNATLAQLRKLGLDDQTYQKLLQDGTADQQFADQLLAGGATAIQGLNSLDAQLSTASENLGKAAAKNLYQAGVNAAQALVNGLKDDKAEIESTMDDIAKSMVNAIKRRLKIKSPSQIFVELGQLTMDGLSKGISDGSDGATKALTSSADDLVAAAQATLGKVPDLLGGITDMEPTITPVLDLSQVQKDAQQLSDLTNVTPITAAASFGQATAASQEVSASQQAVADAMAVAKPTFEFNQNNYSPEALSEIEIYRQTNNQLSTLKRVVGIP